MTSDQTYYITTPIYYVNDRPHVGHCYTTIVADCAARFMRLAGRDVFFLTGTDEHAEKVVASAAANGMTPIQWADRNAEEFERAFKQMECSNDDFIRTTQSRHTEKVQAYIRRLMETGDIYLGDYVGWYDPSQEEYLTETVAREHDFKSPITGRDLEKRTEKNYFFRLKKYADDLSAWIEQHDEFILPEARRNEVKGRLAAGLGDVPISRAVGEDDESAWGILMPGDESHRVYVWIDALFNYLSTVDEGNRRQYWPAQVHLIAKDILWFHAVIWPCMLMALGEQLPKTVYAHSFWIREGRKMSKSLGNFLDLPTIEAYCDAFSVDALRWYLLTQGPMGATDSDFAHDKFVEVYNADLANGIGNAFSRVTNMIAKYFDGKCPDAGGVTSFAEHDWPGIVGGHVAHAAKVMGDVDIDDSMHAGLAISNAVDGFIHATEPFKLAKDESKLGDVGVILYHAAEALRIAAILLSPAMPSKMGDLLERLGQPRPNSDGSFALPLEQLCAWGGLQPGTQITKGEALFPRADVKADPPVAATA